MNGKELAQVIRERVADGTITTYKQEEERRRVSRTTIDRDIAAGRYEKIRNNKEWLLVKIENHV